MILSRTRRERLAKEKKSALLLAVQPATCRNDFLCGRLSTACRDSAQITAMRNPCRPDSRHFTSGLPTTRPECELGLGCMYSSPSAHFAALHTFQAIGNSEKPHATMASGAPSRSGPPALVRGRMIKRRIISWAQRVSRPYERTRTNQEVYYQPTGAKTQ